MNPKWNARTLRAVVAARTRMRDAAAASAAAADRDHARALAASQAARAELDHQLDDTRDRMPRAASVHEIERMADELTGDRAASDDAEQTRDRTETSAWRAKIELRRHANQLRSTERALDNHLEAREALQNRDEQRTSDDLGSRPRRP